MVAKRLLYRFIRLLLNDGDNFVFQLKSYLFAVSADIVLGVQVAENGFDEVSLNQILIPTADPYFTCISGIFIPAKLKRYIGWFDASALRLMKADCIDDFVHAQNHGLVPIVVIVVVARFVLFTTILHGAYNSHNDHNQSPNCDQVNEQSHDFAHEAHTPEHAAEEQTS